MSSVLTDKLYYSTSVVGDIGKFSHTSGGVETGFLRKINIVKIDLDGVGDTDAQVTAMVVWKRTDFPTDCSVATNCMMATMDLIAK